MNVVCPPSDGSNLQTVGSAVDIRPLNGMAARKLERYSTSPALAQGQINLISLDPIAERLADRWALKRDAVYDYTERTLEKHVGDLGYYLRVSETDFLVVLPHERVFAAQLRCLRYLRLVLTHFLGEARPSDLTVRSVSRISQDSLDAALVDPVAVELAAEKEEPAAADGYQPVAGVDRWTPFVASNGINVRVSCALEPVFELKTYNRIGNRIVRRVLRVDTDEPLTVAEIQNLSRSDIERIDLATISRGLDRLRTETGEQLTLIVPVSFTSLSNRHGRSSMSGLFEEAKAFVKTGVICEVGDIEGVPQTALLAAVSLIKPYCLFLIGRLAAAPERHRAELCDVGLQAISFEAPEGSVSDAEFSRWARSAIGFAKQIAKSAIIYRLNSPRHAAMAGLLGASHASIRSAARKDEVAPIS
ncbi:MAG: hypothetical protein JO303_14395 [Caulobacteraceae bacterium]|nr:hypothetical protein [Caulobacteraceae bacterium]